MPKKNDFDSRFALKMKGVTTVAYLKIKYEEARANFRKSVELRYPAHVIDIDKETAMCAYLAYRAFYNAVKQ